MNEDPLATLRDIHLPEPVSWWPLAPGWWWLIGALLTIGGLMIWRRRQRSKLRLRDAALRELTLLTTRCADDQAAFVQALSALIRRCAVARFSSQEAAGLIGESWLAFLDRHGGSHDFTQGPGRALLTGPYSNETQVDTAALTDVTRRWICQAMQCKPSTQAAVNR